MNDYIFENKNPSKCPEINEQRVLAIEPGSSLAHKTHHYLPVYKQMHEARERNKEIASEPEALSQVCMQQESSYMLPELFDSYAKTENMVKKVQSSLKHCQYW